MKRTALITGASSGIGLELAKVFAKNNIDLVLTARNSQALEELKKDLTNNYKINVFYSVHDLSNLEEVENLLKFLEKNNIHIDYLVNNAGFGLLGEFTKNDLKTEIDMINLNISALVYLTKKLLPKMLDNNYGRIMNVASTAAFQPGPYMAVYYATKAFVLSFSEALAYELKEKNITVTALCPGPTKSNFQKNAKIENVKLFKMMNVPDSKVVAEYGFKAMMRGKRLAVQGWTNKIFSTLTRFIPKPVLLYAVAFLQKKKVH